MVTCGPEPDLFAFYTSRYAEDDRLRISPHGRLEFARTRELLERHLPPAPARVLDVGGGTGVHARRLSENGYQTHVVDLVQAHVAQAASIPGVTAAVGDARRLDQPDSSVDVVLLLGPLYHLLERADRVAALTEARRVVRKGGLVAAAAISRYAGLLDFAALGLLDEHTEPLLREVIDTGRHDPRLGFTTAYVHSLRTSPARCTRRVCAPSTSSASRARPAPPSTPTGWTGSTNCYRLPSGAREPSSATRR